LNLPLLASHAEKLIYFFEVSESGSLQASGRKKGISAPTISYAIKQLEEVIGTQLFIRSKTGMKLTPAGKHLKSFCNKHFKEMQNLETLLKKPDTKPITQLRFGTFQSIALYFWPFMMEVLKDNPNIGMSIMTNRSDKIVESLLKKEIDIAITVEGKQTPELIRHELYEDEYSSYISSKIKKNKLEDKEIKNLPLMYIPDAIDANGVSLKQQLYMTKLQFKEVFEIDSFEVIAEFTKRNYGVGLLPRKVAKKYAKEIKEIKIEGTPNLYFGRHRFFLSYRKDLDISQLIMSLVLDSAHQAVKSM
jgi:DNA-binding transcriptional LysR family regulator